MKIRVRIRVRVSSEIDLMVCICAGKPQRASLEARIGAKATSEKATEAGSEKGIQLQSPVRLSAGKDLALFPVRSVFKDLGYKLLFVIKVSGNEVVIC